MSIKYNSLQVFIEDREDNFVWIAILNERIRKEHADLFQAIILTGACQNEHEAKLIAETMGYNFSTNIQPEGNGN